MLNFSPDGPDAGNPEAVVTAVVPIPESFVLRVGTVETELLAVLGAAVVVNPNDDPELGVAEVRVADGRLKDNPVLTGVAAVPPNLRLFPRENPPVVVAGAVAPSVGRVLGLLVDAVAVTAPKDSPD